MSSVNAEIKEPLLLLLLWCFCVRMADSLLASMFNSSRVYTYTADQLLAVRGSAPVRPSRSVRKSIFKYHLWLPARDRFTTTDSTSSVFNESQ